MASEALNSAGIPFRPTINIFVITLLFFLSCAERKKDAYTSFRKYVDTAVSVYGPYLPVKLPIASGVKISNPIQVSLGPDGFIYGSNQTGEIYSLRDTDNDGVEDMALLYCNVKDYGLRSPAGFTHRGDTIYIGTAQQIRAFLDKDKDGKSDTSWVFFDDIPNSEHPYEWSCGLNFGPDGWLYMVLSTDSWNAAPSPDPNGYRGSILRISPDGKSAETMASGIRSVYGMTFAHNGELFFTDNEGGGNAKEELNVLVKGSFYGHNPQKFKFDAITPPLYALETEMAPSGIEFNPPDNDFGGTPGNLFVAFYGPGERWTRGGVGRITIEGKSSEYNFREFPVADIPKLSDLAFGKDGSLYLAQHGKADYWYNAIYENQGNFYRLIYDVSLSAKPQKVRSVQTASLSPNAVEAGKQLYAEHACLGCHAVDGATELLGPNLKDIGKRMNRDEILEEILKPSERIKPSMMGVRIIKKDGKVLVGRIVNSNENDLSLMLIGNNVVKIPRTEVSRTENEEKSLMYEGLLNNMADTEKESLINYLISLSR